MPRQVTVSDARASLPEIIERVTAGEEVTLTRHGTPVAVIVRPDRLRSRQVDDTFRAAERILDLVHEARDRPVTAVAHLSPEEVDEWVAEIRAGRDRDPGR